VLNRSYTNNTDGATICESGLPYIWEGITFSKAGTETKTLKTINGCDSVVTFTLNVLPEYNTTDGTTVYDYELPYIWEDITFTEAGSKDKTFTSMLGCDSTVTFTLTVIPTATLTAEANNSDFGTITGDGRYTINETVTLTATANSGYKFVRWSNGSTVNPYIFTITEDTYLRAIFSAEEEDGTNMTAQQEKEKIVFTWTAVTGAHTYTLTICLDELHTQVFCLLTFDEDGHLQSKDTAPKKVKAAEATLHGGILTYEADFLEPSTTYYYHVQTTNAAGQILDTEVGEFKTNATATSLHTASEAAQAVSFVKDGHLYILRGEKIYDVTGMEVR